MLSQRSKSLTCIFNILAHRRTKLWANTKSSKRLGSDCEICSASVGQSQRVKNKAADGFLTTVPQSVGKINCQGWREVSSGSFEQHTEQFWPETCWLIPKCRAVLSSSGAEELEHLSVWPSSNRKQRLHHHTPVTSITLHWQWPHPEGVTRFHPKSWCPRGTLPDKTGRHPTAAIWSLFRHKVYCWFTGSKPLKVIYISNIIHIC